MLRLLTALSLLTFLGQPCFVVEDKPPEIPRSGDVVRYQRYSAVAPKEKPWREVPAAQGDDLLAALDSGRAVTPWRQPPNVICALPIPTPIGLTAVRKDGTEYRIYASYDGSLVTLPEGWYIVNEPARARVAKVLAWLCDDARKEVTSLPRPCTYCVGSVEDSGTLSGIARLFYGDARKWKQIYQANRAAIRNPNVIGPGLKLTIPKLD